MVHNGIEYGDMQLICEAYNLMKDALGMDHDEMAAILAEWNKGQLDSFLIEISANILKYKDTDGQPLVEKIRDAAGQKGTGKWTAISALEYGMPVTLIGKKNREFEKNRDIEKIPEIENNCEIETIPEIVKIQEIEKIREIEKNREKLKKLQ